MAVLTASQAHSADALRVELSELAKAVKDVLEEEKQTGIAIGDFTGPPQLDSQFGPGIQIALTDELKKAGVTVNKRAELSITGNYADGKDEVNGDTQLVVKINARILARNGDEILRLSQKLPSRKVRDNATIAQMTGATVSLPPSASKQDRNDAIQKALNDPKVHIDGTKVLARPGGLLGVEVLVKPTAAAPAAPRAPEVRDGEAFVDVNRDEVYELRLHNLNPACDAAVAVSIDGVDVFTFSKDVSPKTGRPLYTHFILGPGGAARVAGWHVTNDANAAENVLSFKVTEYGKGAASQLGTARGKVGVITVTYAAAAPTKDGLPGDDGGRGAGGNETGFGPGQKQDLKAVKREIGVVREVVSVPVLPLIARKYGTRL